MIRIVTAPPYYPVSLAEAKLWIREDGTDQDNVITMLLSAMTNHAEKITGRAFVKRTLELNLPRFAHTIELPWAPLIGIDSVGYTDTDEAAQVVATTEYEVDTTSEPGRVRPLSSKFWPSIGTRFNPVKIQYRAGYETVGSPQGEAEYQAGVPDELKTWIHARFATLYENREQLIQNNQVEIPKAFADGMLDGLIIGTRFF